MELVQLSHVLEGLLFKCWRDFSSSNISLTIFSLALYSSFHKIGEDQIKQKQIPSSGEARRCLFVAVYGLYNFLCSVDVLLDCEVEKLCVERQFLICKNGCTLAHEDHGTEC